jgi:CheY-like chemotaxis protein
MADRTSTHVLVVDDSEAIRLLVVAILEDAGHELSAASSVEAGLAIMAEEPIDLVLSDLELPGLSGLDFLEVVRMTRGDLPFLLMTAADFGPFAERARSAKLDGHLAKPFELATLQNTVAAALDGRPALGASAPRLVDATAGRPPFCGGVHSAQRRLAAAAGGAAVAIGGPMDLLPAVGRRG